MRAVGTLSSAAARLEAHMAQELRQLAAEARRRELRPPRGRDFCSNDYLGLTEHPAIRAAVLRAVQAGIPLGAGSARLVRGEHPAFAELEGKFAALQEAEAALFFSSGYAANCGLLAAVARRGDLVFSDRLNHASLIDGIRLSGAERVRVAHGDLNAWERALQGAPPAGTARRFAVVESIHSMEGDRTPLRPLAELCARAEVALIVDEAHATGLCGANGAGCVVEAGLRGEVFAAVHPCGKALGAAGAFVVGSAVLRDYLINRARTFIFSTAPPPWLAAQISTALAVIAAEPWRREQVWKLARRLRRHLQDAGLSTGRDDAESAILPVVLGSDARAVAVAEALAQAGFDARAIRPPTVPEGTARLRVTVNANQTEDEIDAFATALRACVLP